MSHSLLRDADIGLRDDGQITCLRHRAMFNACRAEAFAHANKCIQNMLLIHARLPAHVPFDLATPRVSIDIAHHQNVVVCCPQR